MTKAKEAEEIYDLTMQISDVIYQLGISGDPVELQQRLTDLNQRQIEIVQSNFSGYLCGDKKHPVNSHATAKSGHDDDADESNDFSQQKSLLQRIFNRT